MTTFRPPYRLLGCFVMVLVIAVLFPTATRGDERDGRREVTVRCDKGRSIGEALAQHEGALTIKVVGTCDEHVAVDRNDVRLIADGPGAGINGPDPTINTVMVTGDRFVLDALTVTGGRNAVVVAGGGRAMIRNCVARGGGNGIVGGIGIVLTQGANGTVDNCESSGNAADGLMLEGAIGIITNSRFVSNGRAGILVFQGSTARIGMTSSFTVAPNLIRSNGSAGIHVTLNSLGLIVGNEISGNGTNPAGPFGRTGVTVFHSRADLPGGNLITGNFGQGVLIAAGSSAAIGDPGFALPTRNVIRGNSISAPSQGISVTLNSTLGLRDATVDGNNGAGVALAARSTINVVSSTITGNTVNGVQLSQGSAAIFQPIPPVSDLSGNTGTDLKCLDAESSYTGPIAPGATIDCTGF